VASVSTLWLPASGCTLFRPLLVLPGNCCCHLRVTSSTLMPQQHCSKPCVAQQTPAQMMRQVGGWTAFLPVQLTTQQHGLVHQHCGGSLSGLWEQFVSCKVLRVDQTTTYLPFSTAEIQSPCRMLLVCLPVCKAPLSITHVSLCLCVNHCVIVAL